MSLIDDIKLLRDALLPDNSNQSISAEDLRQSQDLLYDNLSNLGSNYYGAIVPSSPAISGVEENATVLPLEDGTYPNYGGLIRDNEICMFIYESSVWVKKTIQDIPVIEIGKNKYNYETNDLGFVVFSTGNILYTPTETDNELSDFIDVSGSLYYYLSGRTNTTGGLVFYASDKTTKILPVDMNGTPLTQYRLPYINGIMRVPVGAKYVRFTVMLSDVGTPETVQLEEGQIQTEFRGFDKANLPDYVKKVDKPILSETQVSKNLFDKTAVLEGFFISTTTGALVSNVDAAVSDLIPINEKSNYYLSGRNLGVAYNVTFYDENEAILPTIWLTYQPPTEDISFLTPENAAFVRFTVKISGVGTYDAIQLEYGQAQTAYDSFDETEEKIPVSYLPDVSKDILTILVENDFLYIRTKFDNTRDLIQKVGVYFLDDKNDVVNFQDTKLIDGGEINDIAIFEAGELIHNCPDDAAPNNYNGSFIGGNHGCSDMRVVTSVGHGKTNEDVGSEWTDVSANKFYIIKIIDSDTLWMLSENIGTAEIWDFITTINGDLTHSNGATHTATIVVGGVVGGQMFPSIKNHKKKIVLDGALIKTNGIYQGGALDLIDEYDIVNTASALDYLIDNVGNSNPLPLNNGDAQVLNQVTYRFLPNGSCTIYTGWLSKQEVDIFYNGFTQMAVLSAAINPKIKMYMPKSLPISDGVTNFDFRNIDDLTIPLIALTFDPTKWETPLSPINRAIEYSATSGDVLKVGFAHGYDPTKGIGIDANRVNLVTHAWSISTGRKSYPRAFDFTLIDIQPNKWYNGIAFRHYFNPELLDNAHGFTYYEVANKVIVNIDYQGFTGIDSIELPSKYLGMTASVIEKSSNINLLNDFVVESGISIHKTSNDYSYITIELQ